MGVVPAVAAVAQQHVVGVSFTPADAAASVENGARPEDASLQTGQVDEHLSRVRNVNMHANGACLLSANQSAALGPSDLRQTGAGLQRLPPSLQHRLADTASIAAV